VATFSAADAALTGFRIVAERPWAVAIWAALQFVVSLALALLVATTAGPAFTRLSEMGLQPTDPAAALQLMGQVAPTYFALLSASLVLYAVLFAAMNRAVLRPGDAAFGYLRLSGDELRQLGLFILLFAIAIGVYLALAIVAVALGVVLAFATGPSTGVSLIVAILIPAVIAAFAFVGVRLSLASPLAFDRHRIDLAAAWSMTRGRFWPMLGAYLIAFALSVVVLVLTLAIGVAVVAVVGGGVGALGAVMQPNLGDPTAVVNPVRLAYVAITAVGQALTWPITLAAPAAIYRALAATSPGQVGRAFE
jgi:hypothetical protein